MRNIKLKIQYDGTDYHGWQIQKNDITVQETVKKAVQKIVNEDVHLTGCGRTDTGVHAENYVCNFFTNSRIPSEKLPYALNTYLPNDIVCFEAEDTDENFHSNSSAVKKRYVYKILNREFPDVVMNRYSWHYKYPLDIEKMRIAAKAFIGEHDFIARPYGLDDIFKGALNNETTMYLNIPFSQWMQERGLDWETIEGRTDDLQSAAIFPRTNSIEELGIILRWMTSEPQLEKGKELWKKSVKVSADEISANANLKRLYTQRCNYRCENWKGLAANYEKSVFYQLDLQDAANEFVHLDLETPDILKEDAAPMVRIHNRMLHARIMKLRGNGEWQKEEQAAFQLLRDGLLGAMSARKNHPTLSVYSDQIVWGRSPVRIDMAGGWTDTPPYSLYSGGSVVNLAIELNGQPPLQVYVKPCKEFHIVLRSIDMGAMEVISNYDELQDYKKVGSPFSIPKAALTLAGFAPAFSAERYTSLEEQLKSFGSGLEITLLAAIPAGSGLGTSSILASTVLGAINDFCGLAWDKNEICSYTLVLEQLLTTGGGWQDQYGGVFSGVKLLQSEAGFEQNPLVRWLPDQLFVHPDYRDCHLLYYTGITRTAKGILAEIVSSMFLNSGTHLSLLAEMKAHTMDMSEAILRSNFTNFGNLVGKTWIQNQALDCGTNPPAVAAIIEKIKDYTLGYKLPGAGGGGYLYMVAKDPQAAGLIRRILTEEAPNPRARFVEMSLSDKGLQISRS